MLLFISISRQVLFVSEAQRKPQKNPRAFQRKRKPWRNFKRNRKRKLFHVPTVRQLCCILLIMELAVLTRNAMYGENHGGTGAGKDLDALRVESSEERVLVPADEEAVLERFFGIRIRVREGALEFYQSVESQERPEN